MRDHWNWRDDVISSLFRLTLFVILVLVLVLVLRG